MMAVPRACAGSVAPAASGAVWLSYHGRRLQILRRTAGVCFCFCFCFFALTPPRPACCCCGTLERRRHSTYESCHLGTRDLAKDTMLHTAVRASAQSLTSLGLAQNFAVSDSGLAWLARLPRLRSLSLGYTAVSGDTRTAPVLIIQPNTHWTPSSRITHVNLWCLTALEGASRRGR